MLFKNKVDYTHIHIYEFNNALQTLSLLYKGENIPKIYKHSKKLWTGIDKTRKIKTIILCS